MKRARHKIGSVVFDDRRRVWNYLYCENGVRRTRSIGKLRDYPTKSDARRAAEAIRQTLNSEVPDNSTPTVKKLAQAYQTERMPTRAETRRAYCSWIRNYIVPKWGDAPITAIQPRPVELWLRQLELSPKSKSHIRNLLHTLIDFAMWSGAIRIGRNPVSLVVVQGASKRLRKPRSLTVEQFQKLCTDLKEPFRTMALLCVCFGLRISEALGLKWGDIDWLNSRLSIERGVVRQVVGDVKTDGSRRTFVIADELLGVLKLWKQTTQFGADGDWVFASPVQLGRLPYSYTEIRRELGRATGAAGIGHVTSHAFRHTYRSWLDAVGTSVAVQQKLMRHSDIRTTLNVYGDVVTDEMQEATSKVAGLALSRA